MVDPIINSKNIINQVETNLEKNFNDRSQITESLDQEFEQLLEKSIDNTVIENDESGISLFVLTEMYDQMVLKENLLSKSKEIFQNVSKAWQKMSTSTEKETKRAINQELNIDHQGLNSKQKKRLRYITKKLIESYYFDYNVVLNEHNKLKTLYSKKFFDELINSFKLAPRVDKIVRGEFRDSINKIVKKVTYLGKQELEQYKEDNPNSSSPIKNQNQLYTLLNSSDKQEIQMQASELIGRIIGFAAAISIGEYFKTNSNALESITNFKNDNGQLLEQILNSITSDSIRNEKYNNAYNLTEKDSPKWDSLSEEEIKFLDMKNDTIFDQYINNGDNSNE
ncbi:hypothetical protein PBI_SCTP2_157 [Salicola phage SCTP-2]|nr:hypothetical protein PBI_SCTP2_157 [Salicola phage SCTP-2]